MVYAHFNENNFVKSECHCVADIIQCTFQMNTQEIILPYRLKAHFRVQFCTEINTIYVIICSTLTLMKYVAKCLSDVSTMEYVGVGGILCYYMYFCK